MAAAVKCSFVLRTGMGRGGALQQGLTLYVWHGDRLCSPRRTRCCPTS